LSVSVVPELPGGQITMFDEQVGEGIVHEKVAPGGLDASGMVKATPEQVPWLRLVVRSGTGLMFMAREMTGLGLELQLVFVP
jgi:hypothetical protein